MTKHILLRPIWALSFIFGLASAAQADRAKIFELIRSSDVASVETLMGILHEEHLAGEIQASDIRTPFGTFSLTDASLGDFLQVWLMDHPNSPYAHAAAGWYYFGLAWRLRGEDLPRYTWREGLDGFYDALHQAEVHGHFAYKAAPDLIASSDLLIVLEQTLHRLGESELKRVIATAMSATPNRGTILRAARSFDPRWGGRESGIVGLCNLYWNKIPSTQYPSPRICVAEMLIEMGYSSQKTREAVQIINETGWAALPVRKWQAFNNRNTRSYVSATHEDYVAYLENGGSEYLTWISEYYQELYSARTLDHPFEMRPKMTELLLRAKDIARERQTWDPGSPALLKVLASAHYDDKTSDIKVDPKEIFDHWGEVLRAHPYDWRHWADAAAQATVVSRGHESMRLAARMQGNVIAYSNHAPGSFFRVLADRARVLQPIVEGWTRRDADGALVETPQNVPQDVTCDTLRLARLREVVCEADPSGWGCSARADATGHFVATLRRQSISENTCIKERTAPIEDIVYYPQTVRVGDYLHSVEPSFDTLQARSESGEN